MVTATQQETIDAYKANAPVVKASYELPRSRERFQMRYAHLHLGRTDIYEYIFNRYCPRIELRSVPKEKRATLSSDVRMPDEDEFRRMRWLDLPEFVQTGETEVETGKTYQRARGDAKVGDPIVEKVKATTPLLVPDPDVIWVGRISDGLAWLGVFQNRQQFGDFFNTVSSDTSGSVEFEFTRSGRVVRWGDVLMDTEPGEIRNSPDLEFQIDPDEITWASPVVQQSWVPMLMTDPRYGMHYLRRGDRIRLSANGWPGPRNNGVAVYELRPPSEGSSRVIQGTDAGVETVGNAPRVR